MDACCSCASAASKCISVQHELEARAAGGLSNRLSRMSPDDPSPISGIQGKDLPFRDPYPPIKDPYLPFPQPDQGRFQLARISPDYPHGDRGHQGRPLTTPHSVTPSLLSSDVPLNKFQKANRTGHALSSHVGATPAFKKTDAGFSLPPIIVSNKDRVVSKSPHAKKAEAHKSKHDRHKHSSHHQKHAKAHRDKSSTEKPKGPKVDSDLLILRGCALSALSSSAAAGRTKLQQPQQQEPQQQQQQQQAELPVVYAAEEQLATLASGQLHAQQQGNWQTTFAQGPGQGSPCAGAAPNSPEVCQRTLGLLAFEHFAQAGAHAHAFPSSLQAPSPQAHPQLLTSTKRYAETSPTPTNPAISDWNVMTTARLAGTSALCTTEIQGSPDAGSTPDHDMQDLDMQCITKPTSAIKQVTDALSCGSCAVHCLAVMHWISTRWVVLLAVMREFWYVDSLTNQVMQMQMRYESNMRRSCLKMPEVSSTPTWVSFQ